MNIPFNLHLISLHYRKYLKINKLNDKNNKVIYIYIEFG